MKLSFQKYIDKLDKLETVSVFGRVTQVIGLIIEGSGPPSSLGTVCSIHPLGVEPVEAVVVGFNADKILLMPLGSVKGISPGSKIIARGNRTTVSVGSAFIGRVIDGLGNPIDGKGEIITEDEYPLSPPPINPMSRKRIAEPLDLGIKVINGLFAVGKGQRMGIFAGSGVGKSVLLGMIAQNTTADLNVIALIGERGREVKEFLERDLGEEGMARSIVVVATSDQPPLIRLRGLYIAAALSEFFRNQGKDVLLMVDSLTRFAMAQREIGLAVGEPPTTKGYTPSVFSELPQILERAGNNEHGSITGLYTVLVEGDDMNDPIADAARSILDGHILLSRDIAAKNHYPPVDILNSISRVMKDVTGDDHMAIANRFVEIAATYADVEDLVNIGAYKKGSSSKVDLAVEMKDRMDAFLKQGIGSKFTIDESVSLLAELIKPRGKA